MLTPAPATSCKLRLRGQAIRFYWLLKTWHRPINSWFYMAGHNRGPLISVICPQTVISVRNKSGIRRIGQQWFIKPLRKCRSCALEWIYQRSGKRIKICFVPASSVQNFWITDHKDTFYLINVISPLLVVLVPSSNVASRV